MRLEFQWCAPKNTRAALTASTPPVTPLACEDVREKRLKPDGRDPFGIDANRKCLRQRPKKAANSDSLPNRLVDFQIWAISVTGVRRCEPTSNIMDGRL